MDHIYLNEIQERYLKIEDCNSRDWCVKGSDQSRWNDFDADIIGSKWTTA